MLSAMDVIITIRSPITCDEEVGDGTHIYWIRGRCVGGIIVNKINQLIDIVIERSLSCTKE